jgi:2-polyprenyl-3-methyl-5-hydroxy-6-metoxy-1,4-benzoquinol methylase
MAVELLTGEDAFAYWDSRHQRQDDLRSGGHIGIDQAANEVFYARRLGKLLEIIGDRTSPGAPLFVLDAGCGKGHFARALARCGHRVDAIDASPTAIGRCRDLADGPRYALSTLSSWRSPWLYDLVLSIDVLFHILDDREWAASVRNLASLVRFAGKLVITDEDTDRRRQRGDYIQHRPQREYRDLLASAGFASVGHVPYAFRENRVGFFVFVRNR